MRILLVLCLTIGSVAYSQPVTVATDLWPPFRILANDGQLVGYDIDVLAEVSHRSGLVFDVQKMPWARALQHLEFGQSDIMVGLAYTNERAQYIDYLYLVYKSCSPAFYGRQEFAQQVTSFESLTQFRVGYVNDSAYFPRFDNDINILKVGTPREEQLLRMANAGNIELFIGTDCQVDYELSQRPELKLTKALWQPPDRIDLYFGFSKHNDLTAEKTKIEAALQAMQTEGFFDQLNKQYFGY